MKIASKSSFVGLFILGLAIFSAGLQAVAHSMAYGGIKYNFIAETWIFPSTYLLAIAFGLGWWVGKTEEYLLLNEQRKLALLLFLGISIVYAAVGGSSFLVSGFAGPIIEASAHILYSGFCFRLSVIKSEAITKALLGKKESTIS